MRILQSVKDYADICYAFEEMAMSPPAGIFEINQRARHKSASRARDVARLEAGIVNRADLAQENGFFSALPMCEFRIVSIGRRGLRNAG